MVTVTTYGTWLRGDARGWVDDGVTFPKDPTLESNDRQRMKFAVFQFHTADLLRVGESVGKSLIERLSQTILALTVDEWHAHFVVGATEAPIAEIVKCAKDAARYALRPGRPI
jgi:hypothetical protein